MEEAIDKVKRKIWSYGYACKDVSNIPGLSYDLYVEEKYQVKVVSKKEPKLEGIPNEVIVAFVDGEKISFQICERGVCIEETSPLKAFSS